MVPIVDYPPVVQRYLPHFRPHFANEPQFKHFAEYLTGLIVCWKFSVAFMNSQFVGHRDPSTKTRFLSEVDWPEDRVEQTRIGLILKRIQGISPRKCRLAIDDVLIHHDRSKVMEGVSKHYDHCTGTYGHGPCPGQRPPDHTRGALPGRLRFVRPCSGGFRGSSDQN